jgi:hypothetical protein
MIAQSCAGGCASGAISETGQQRTLAERGFKDEPYRSRSLAEAGTSGFVAGCRVNQLDAPSFGALEGTLDDNYQIYGLIRDIRIDDDGLVRQWSQRMDRSCRHRG